MTPENLTAIEQRAQRSLFFRHVDDALALRIRTDAREVCAALRQEWKERDEMAALLKLSKTLLGVCRRERDEAKAECQRLRDALGYIANFGGDCFHHDEVVKRAKNALKGGGE